MNDVIERNPNSSTTLTEQQQEPLTVGKTPLNIDRDLISDEPQNVGKEPLKIDFDKVFDSSRDETPAEIVVVSSVSGTGDSDRRRRRRKRKKLSDVDGSMNDDGGTGGGGGGGGGGGEDMATMRDSEIEAMIDRTARNIANLESKLPDKGAKLKSYLQKLEEELQRRKHYRSSQQDDHGCKKPAHPDHASVNDSLEGFTRDVRSSLPPERSAFATSFMKKLEGEAKPKPEEKKLEDNVMPKSEQNIGDQSNSAFNDELILLGRCDKRKRSLAPLPSRKAKSGPPSKDFYPWKPRNGFNNSETCRPLGGNLTSRASSMGTYRQSKEKLADSCNVKDTSPAQKLNGLKNDQTVVLVDEDEEPEESNHEAEQLPTNNIEGKIYYPSREDPETLEIFRSELKCLQPGEFLTSTIMNFYIRFLQESSPERLQKNVYFFNTYFYNKLQEAVAYQKSDQEAFFVKFRRWWRGINLFQKAYIFLPINEDKHWSLVIICIPEEGDKSGPIVLHLDSLGLHCSQAIFRNIRSLLKNERNVLNEDRGNLDIPISEHIWRNLDRRIDERIIPVPRQTNDYDCGLFVLYYMERFIEQAPDRMTKQALETKFGRNWFKPQEASSLRGKIRKILEEKFHQALKENDTVWQPVCLTANAEAAKP